MRGGEGREGAGDTTEGGGGGKELMIEVPPSDDRSRALPLGWGP